MNTALRIWIVPTVLVLAAVTGHSWAPPPPKRIFHFEDFTRKGKPTPPPGTNWSYADTMLPLPKGKEWEALVPGDGFAHLTIDTNKENDKKKKAQPYQIINLSPVGPGHRLEFRARNTAVSGVGGFIFTYMEDRQGIDEIDIEIVPDDYHVAGKDHDIDPPKGWTDARFNSWGNTSVQKHISHKKAIVDAEGKKVSHRDDMFHTYTIEWKHVPGGDGRQGRIEFRIDGVHQATIRNFVPDTPSDVIIGFRHMPSWCGPFNWKGTETMTIDWVRITPWDEDHPVARADNYAVPKPGMVKRAFSVPAEEGVLQNDEPGGAKLRAVLTGEPQYGKVRLNPDGSFQYTPGKDFKDADSFSYHATTAVKGKETNAATVLLEMKQP